MFWQLWRAVLRLRKSMVSRCKWSLYCARFTLHGLLCTVYSEQFTLHDLLCKIYSAQFTPHDLLCSIYSAVWSDQWWVWQCLMETCLEVVWWLWSPHLPSPTFSALLLTHATVQTTLHATPPSLHFLLVAAPSLRSLNGRKARPLGNAYFLELLHPTATTAATAATGDQIWQASSKQTNKLISKSCVEQSLPT